MAKHDYIAKVDLPNNKKRYFYTQAEYDAYLHPNKAKDDKTSKIDKAKEWLDGKLNQKKDQPKPQTTDGIVDDTNKIVTDTVDKAKAKAEEVKKDLSDIFNSIKDKYESKKKEQEAKSKEKDAKKKAEEDRLIAELKQKEFEKSADKMTDLDDAVMRKAKTDFNAKKYSDSVKDGFERAKADNHKMKLIDGTQVLLDSKTDRLYYEAPDGTVYHTKYAPKKLLETPFKTTNDSGQDQVNRSWISVTDTTKDVNQKTEAERKAEVDRYRANEPDWMKDLPKIDHVETYDDVQNAINENFYTAGSDYQNNCIFSTMTYEMRCRGYDVDVKGLEKIRKPETGLNCGYNWEYDPWLKKLVKKGSIYEKMFEQDKINNYGVGTIYENPDTRSVWNEGVGKNKNPIEVIQNMYPPNSRGDISVIWAGGMGGHSMVFETDKNGKLLIRDTQVHKTYTTESEIMDLLNQTDMKYTITTRTDNLKFKENAKYAVRNN